MQYLRPGAYRQDVKNLEKQIAGVGTAIVGLPLVCKTGPVGIAVKTNSWTQFENTFGGLLADYLATFCLQVHYQNAGNSPVWVTRVTDGTATRASFSMTLNDSPSALAIEAKYEGTEGNSIILTTTKYSPVTTTSAAAESGAITSMVVKSTDGFKINASAKVSQGVNIVYSKITSVNSDTNTIGWTDATPAVAGTVTIEVMEIQLDVSIPDGTSEVLYVSLMQGADNFIEDVLAQTQGGQDSESLFLSMASGLITSYPTASDARPTNSTIAINTSGTAGLSSLDGTDFTSTSTGGEGLAALSEKEDITLVTIPDLHAATLTLGDSLIAAAQIAGATFCDLRKDCSYIAAVPQSKALGTDLNTSAYDYVTSTVNYNSKRLDFYYPWVKVSNPLTGRFIWLPPCLVTGVISRVDNEIGNFQDPAGDIAVISGVIDLEYKIGDTEQDDLNPAGINCIRSIPNVGRAIWGCRTQSKDIDFIYISVVRHSDYVYDSLKNSTFPYVFKANTPALRRAVTSVITTFLRREMAKGAFKSQVEAEAFYVKCDSENNTDVTIDEGKLIINYGIAESKPAEFIIYKVAHTVPKS